MASRRKPGEPRIITHRCKMTMDDAREYSPFFADILNEAVKNINQTPHKQARLVEKMKVVFDERDKSKIFEVFWIYLVNQYVTMDTVLISKRLIDFFIQVVLKVGTVSHVEHGWAMKEVLAFKVLRRFTKCYDDTRASVRFGLLYVLHNVLVGIKDWEMPQSLLSSVLKILHTECMTDTIGKNRIMTVNALVAARAFANDDAQLVETIENGFAHHAEFDASPDVRKICTMYMDVNKPRRLELFLRRVSDHSDMVITFAARRIRNDFKICDFTLQQRQSIVRRLLLCEKYLIKREFKGILERWFEDADSDTVTFLRYFEVVTKRDMILPMLDVLFSETDQATLDKIGYSFLVNGFIPPQEMKVEKTFLWTYILNKFKSHPLYDSTLQRPLVEWKDYISRLIIRGEGPWSTDDPQGSVMVLHALVALRLVLAHPTEEASRRLLESEYRQWVMSPYLKVYVVPELARLLPRIVDGQQQRQLFVMEQLQSLLSKSRSDAPKVAAASQRTSQSTDKQDEEMRLQLGLLMNERHTLYRQKIEAMDNPNEQDIESIDEAIKKLSDEITLFRELMNNSVQKEVSEPANSDGQKEVSEPANNDGQMEVSEPANNDGLKEVSEPANNDGIMEVSEPANNDGQKEVSEPANNGGQNEVCELAEENEKHVMSILDLKFMNYIIAEEMQQPNDTLYAPLANFSRKYVFQFLLNDEEPSLQRLAIKVLLLVSMRDKDEAINAMLVLINLIYVAEDETMNVALMATCDLICKYGIKYFENDDRVQRALTLDDIANSSLNNSFGAVEAANDAGNDPSGLRALIFSLIRYKNPVVVSTAVTGILKMLMNKEVSSTKMVIVVLLLWINPVNFSTPIYHTVGNWIRCFARSGTFQAENLAKALTPCLKRILNSDPDDNLRGANTETLVSTILLALTSTEDHFKKSFHVVIAEACLNVMKNKRGMGAKLLEYTKTLKMLKLTIATADEVLHLRNELETVMHLVAKNSNEAQKKKYVLKGCETFKIHLHERMIALGLPVGIAGGIGEQEDSSDEEENFNSVDLNEESTSTT